MLDVIYMGLKVVALLGCAVFVVVGIGFWISKYNRFSVKQVADFVVTLSLALAAFAIIVFCFGIIGLIFTQGSVV